MSSPAQLTFDLEVMLGGFADQPKAKFNKPSRPTFVQEMEETSSFEMKKVNKIKLDVVQELDRSHARFDEI